MRVSAVCDESFPRISAQPSFSKQCPLPLPPLGKLPSLLLCFLLLLVELKTPLGPCPLFLLLPVLRTVSLPGSPIRKPGRETQTKFVVAP